MSVFENFEKEKKQIEKIKKEHAIRKETLSKQFGSEFNKRAKQTFIEGLSEFEQARLIEEIKNELQHDMFARANIKKKGLASPSAFLGITNRIEQFGEKKANYVKEKLIEAGF